MYGYIGSLHRPTIVVRDERRDGLDDGLRDDLVILPPVHHVRAIEIDHADVESGSAESLLREDLICRVGSLAMGGRHFAFVVVGIG